MKDDAKPDQPGYKYARRDPSETREDAIAYLKSQGLNTDEVIDSGLARIKEVEERIKNGIMKHPTDEEILDYATRLTSNTAFKEEIAKEIIQTAKWARDQQPKLKGLGYYRWFILPNKVQLCHVGSEGSLQCSYKFKKGKVLFRADWHTKYWWVEIGEYTDINHGKQLAQADYERRIEDLYMK